MLRIYKLKKKKNANQPNKKQVFCSQKIRFQNINKKKKMFFNIQHIRKANKSDRYANKQINIDLHTENINTFSFFYDANTNHV